MALVLRILQGAQGGAAAEALCLPEDLLLLQGVPGQGLEISQTVLPSGRRQGVSREGKGAVRHQKDQGGRDHH